MGKAKKAGAVGAPVEPVDADPAVLSKAEEPVEIAVGDDAAEPARQGAAPGQPVADGVTAEGTADGQAPDSGDSDEAAAGNEVKAAKKKKKKKKKLPPQQEAVEPVKEETVEDSKEQTVEDGIVEAGEAHVEDSEDEGHAEGDPAQESAPAKKKKKKPKKKGGAGAAQAPVECSRPGVPSEEFLEWTRKALETWANGTEKMGPEELMRPRKCYAGWAWTGPLRPAYQSPPMKMPPGWCMPDYATDPDGISLSERKSPSQVPVLEGKELATMREACRLGREVLDIAAMFMRAGVTGDEIDRVVFQACVDRKIYPSPLNYYRFPKSLCVSPNEVICHGIPDSRPIEEGDIVNLDVSIYHQGFHSDLNETYFIGNCDEDSHRLVRTAYCALRAAAENIRPGTFYRDLGNAIHAEATKSDCAVVTTYCGHGVGELFHGPPKVPHYRKNKAVGVMKPGHVFTVEPMINLGRNGGDKTWPDSWTAVTKDGKRSAQFEHTFLVTEQGLEVLTCRQRTDPSCMPPYDPAMFQL